MDQYTTVVETDSGPITITADANVSVVFNVKDQSITFNREDGVERTTEPTSRGTVVNYHDDLGKRHREDGPAIIWPDGTKHWFKHGKRHRSDGPASIYPDGRCEWWIDGKKYPRKTRASIDVTENDIGWFAAASKYWPEQECDYPISPTPRGMY